MPRFFFHLRAAEKCLMDCDGLVLADAAAAREEAMLAARDFFRPALGCIEPGWEDWSIEARDERGRLVSAMAIADAAEVDSAEPHAATGVRASPVVVDLEMERARRELSSIEHQTRSLIHRASVLADRTRYEALRLYCLLNTIEEGRHRSRELLARSRSQTRSLDWCVKGTGAS